MNEKYLHPQHNSGDEPPEEPPRSTPDVPDTDQARSTEAEDDHDWELRWEISDVILTAVYNLVEQPGPAARATISALARKLVEHVYGASPASDQHQQDLAILTATVNDRIIELADAHDDLTTSDLQGSVGALAFQLVRHQLIVGSAEPQVREGGDHE
ncbi:hypothetical protein [Nocardia brasiliensis]|uniref:hypothetical protein n=1 Tax=Nocardia brasiliensis TaxID=37326 RepID=UPI002456A7EA|nr:hypothetical protein [Nocardia brasiliensis]